MTRRGTTRRLLAGMLFVPAGLLAIIGCNQKFPEGAIVVTQTPLAGPANASPQDILDQRYPPGSRVVSLPLPFRPEKALLLSKGLRAAGAPVVSPDGERIYFAGKAQADGPWQIYQANSRGGSPKIFTSIDGGAMDPAIISTGDLVFSSPVPRVGETWTASPPPALYVQAPGGPPRRLTYGSTAAVEPTVLRDGRILFISARPEPGHLKRASTSKPPDLALFTINNDGTEVMPFALDHDGPAWVHRPRELLDGRVGFVAAPPDIPGAGILAQGLRTAQPFLSRSNLFNFPISNCRSVEPAGQGNLFACLETRGMMGRAMKGSYAVYRINPDAQGVGEPLFDDPAWNEIEAVPVAVRAQPFGHVSAIMPAKDYATILCLDANFTRGSETNRITGKTERVRLLAGGGAGEVVVLGELPVQGDGSFMAEVPTDTPLGFEALDAAGRVLRRSEPFFWARPGENRSCIGCHEPYNRTLRNVRPLAASLPPVVLKANPMRAIKTIPQPKT